MPNTFKESTGYDTIHEAIKGINSIGEFQSFFRIYVSHLTQTKTWGESGHDMDDIAKKLIIAVLKEEQRTQWEGILSE